MKLYAKNILASFKHSPYIIILKRRNRAIPKQIKGRYLLTKIVKIVHLYIVLNFINFGTFYNGICIGWPIALNGHKGCF